MRSTITYPIAIFFLFIKGLSTTLYGQTCEVNGFYHSNFQDVKLILDQNGCNTCHHSNLQQGGWKYDRYEDLIQPGNCQQNPIVNGDASKSYLFMKLTDHSDLCVFNEDSKHRVSDEELHAIERWINMGAPEGCIPVYSEVKAILDNNQCDHCHMPGVEDWHYLEYENFFQNSINCNELQIVAKGNTDQSLLYDKVNNDGFTVCGEEMNGFSGEPLSQEYIDKIRDWINAGAPISEFALPVEISYIELQKIGDAIALTWEVLSEQGTSLYEIERTSNGTTFEKVGSVEAISGNETHVYQFIDEKPFMGSNYYRLKAIDIDGSYDYSIIKHINLVPNQLVFNIFPNPLPSSERLKVEWNSGRNDRKTYMNLVSAEGVQVDRFIIYEGVNYVRLPKNLPIGIYYIIANNYFDELILRRLVIIR